MPYVAANTIKLFAEATEASPSDVWDILAASASLIFDQACGVTENFFAVAGAAATERTFQLNGSGYYFLPPYIEVATITVDSAPLDADNYKIQNDFLIAPELTVKGFSVEVFTVSAKWGFAAIPADVKQAVIEQALFMWRRRDLSFTELSGVSTEAVRQMLSPTCEFVAKKYKEKYFQINV